VLLCAALLTAGSEYRAISAAVLGVNLLLALAEGAVTASAVVFLRKVAAEVLDSSLLLAGPLVKETGRECL
jgi:hypothetical protein